MDANRIPSRGENIVGALCGQNVAQAEEAERDLRFMLDWAGHMSIPAVIIPPIPTDPSMAAHYARLLATMALECSTTNIQLWIRVDACEDGLAAYELLHRRCGSPANLGCMVCFGSNIVVPDSISREYLTLVHRFIGCNTRAVSFSTSAFLRNKAGFPTLPKRKQVFFTEILKRLGRTIRVVVEGNAEEEGSEGRIQTGDAGETGCLAHLQYLRHIRTRPDVVSVLDTEEAQMEASYLDHLQSPLQPLGDNLEFATYETFEKDPVKYARYEDAVYFALRDGAHDMKGATVDVHIMVVGAGRGPLVNASLRAAQRINTKSQAVKVRITAVEKNPSAVVYLRSLAASPAWAGVVQVVECDMRFAFQNLVLKMMIENEGMRADIVVSELLGSFGDNELSPECLDGVQRCGLMKKSCVSIPQSYTSFAAPVTSMRLYSEAQAQAYTPSSGAEGPWGKPSGSLQAMETPYVVRSHAASQTHAEQACWDFVHPFPGSFSESTNVRSAQLTFSPDQSHGSGRGSGYLAHDSKAAGEASAAGGTTVHGFLGTFHATLYKSPNGGEESVISIAPSTFSVGMFSWFPLYFPLREPLHVPAGASVGLSIWRRCSSDRVWYEWCSEVYSEKDEREGGREARDVVSASTVHNPNGRSYFVRL